MLTILEVVIHDPLYAWLLNPLQSRQRQGDEGEKGGERGGDKNGEKEKEKEREKEKNKGKTKDKKSESEKEKEEVEKNKNEKLPALTENNPYQRENAGFSRDAAERTLVRIKNKLLGFDNPTSGGLGIEGQVELVITEARSIDNLSKLFIGWNPWL